MSSLLDSTVGLQRPAGGPDVTPSPLGAALLAAIRAAVTGLLPVLVPVVLAWVLGAGGRATWSQTVRFAMAVWLLAHHGGLAVSGGHVGLVPLGLVVAPLLSCFVAGRRLARTLDSRAERIDAGATRAARASLSWQVLVVFVGAYCVLALLASFAAGMPGLRPVSGQALVGAGVVSAAGGGLGAAAYRWAGVRAGLLAVLRHMPARVRRWLRAALAALAVWMGGSALLVAVMIGTHAGGVTGLYRALDAGWVGGAVLTLGQLALLPNLVVWAGAVAAGPGFTLGAGSTVGMAASALGPLPAVPVLAALPAPGPLPVGVRALVVLPVLAGVVAGVLLARGPEFALLPRLRELGATVAASALGAAVLAWLSGGPAGPGRFSEVGPNLLLTGLAFGAEVAVGAGLAQVVVAVTPALRRARASLEAAVDSVG